MRRADPVLAVLARRSCRSGDLRRLRQGLGLSVRDIATAVGSDCGSISRYERGLSEPRGDRALRLGELIVELVRANDIVDPPTDQLIRLLKGLS